MKEVYIAVDYGGGSGRVIAGSFRQGQLELETISRFGNRQVRMGGHTYWDFLSLFQDMKEGLRMAVRKGYRIKSIGIDTWGVDFGLIDKQGNLLGNPICYRDQFTVGLPEELHGDNVAAHYAVAGIQVMPINTIYQLYGLKKEGDVRLDVADKLLFTPDLFSFFLTGVANNEYSIASTSELLDARSRNWNRELIARLGLPQHLFGEIVMPGTRRGTLRPEVAAEIGVDYPVEVIAVGSHDTASAIRALPPVERAGTRRAFLSSGTWSLLGIELDEPVLTEEARLSGFTNEGGVGGKICFMQNITGLWILQRLRAQWEEEGKEIDYGVLIADAEKASIASIIDVDAPEFQNPDGMEGTIAEHCRATGQQVPATQGEYMLCIMQSLAMRYKRGIDELNRLTGQSIEELCIIGGGNQNRLLNRLTQEALGIPVVSGPVEATAIGNILVQAEVL